MANEGAIIKVVPHEGENGIPGEQPTMKERRAHAAYSENWAKRHNMVLGTAWKKENDNLRDITVIIVWEDPSADY